MVIYLDEDEAEAIVGAVSPEAREIPSKRTWVKVERVAEGVRLQIRAKDVTALRAALNSFLRFIDSALSSIRVADRASFSS